MNARKHNMLVATGPRQYSVVNQNNGHHAAVACNLHGRWFINSAEHAKLSLEDREAIDALEPCFDVTSSLDNATEENIWRIVHQSGVMEGLQRATSAIQQLHTNTRHKKP